MECDLERLIITLSTPSTEASLTASTEDAAETLGLIREYLRRAALWCDAVGDDSPWPLDNLICVVVPGLDADEEDIVLRDIACQLPKKPVFKHLIYNALLWEKYCHLIPTSLTALELPHPYQSIVTLVRRDGWFSTEHGFVDCYGTSLLVRSPQDWLVKQPKSLVSYPQNLRAM